MTATIDGLHHVTAISGNAQENLDFYTKALGQRLVKKTVNFDDPGTYHLYYGDEAGTPGTVMTFFPWEGARKGRVGAGQVSVTQYAVPVGSLPFWVDRLPGMGARLVARETVMGETRAVFSDPHGLTIALVECDDPRAPWLADGIDADHAVRGFHGVTLALHEQESTADILRDIFGYGEVAREPSGTGTLVRFRAGHGDHAGIVDLHVDPGLPAGVEGTGTVHHVAFAVKDRAAQKVIQRRLEAAGHRVTPQIDRDYFWAIYTRTPGGVLFEVATAEPGFEVDEPRDSLGQSLRLPRQHEGMRDRIEAVLPELAT